jgi:hypothetical protein
MARIDDGSREAAVRELGEDTVRAAEVVQAHADRLGVATFRSMGIPAASILEGLGLDAEVAQRRPTLIPPGVRPVPADETGSHSAGLSSPGPGVGR